jgi:hypothetical protein
MRRSLNTALWTLSPEGRAPLGAPRVPAIPQGILALAGKVPRQRTSETRTEPARPGRDLDNLYAHYPTQKSPHEIGGWWPVLTVQR